MSLETKQGHAQQSNTFTLSVTYRCDHDESYQEAHDADEQQQQLSAVASSDQVRVQVSH